MSKPARSLIRAFWAGVGVMLSVQFSAAQGVETLVTVDADGKSAFVEGKFRDGEQHKSLSFQHSAIGIPDLGGRISQVAVKRAGTNTDVRQLRSSEYLSNLGFSEFSYRVDLRPGTDSRSAAHSSWIGKDVGLILLDDILPVSPLSGSQALLLRVKAPAGWAIWSDISPGSSGIYEIPEIGRASFVMAKGLSKKDVSGRLEILSASGFLFSIDEAVGMAGEIFGHYSKLFGGPPGEKVMIVILPFPQNEIPKGVWEAETRGRTVLLVSSDMPFKYQSAQLLHEQLRHEIFHLWVPNAIELSGNYDWFFEGFAIYEALKAGVELNRIRFEDMLDTLSRAFSIDASRTRPLSLIAASNERWKGAETSVYARGMITAFIIDIELLRGSKGRTALENIFRRLFSGHKRPAVSADGNASILGLFERDTGLSMIARAYISGDKPIDMARWLEASGLENASGGLRARLRVRPNLTRQQKTVLDKLGYNSWRKLNRK